MTKFRLFFALSQIVLIAILLVPQLSDSWQWLMWPLIILYAGAVIGSLVAPMRG